MNVHGPGMLLFAALPLSAAAFLMFANGTMSWPALAAGCSPARPHPTGSSSESITTAESTRTYLVHVPPSYSGSDAVPVVLAFHGLTGSAGWMEAYSQLSGRADQPDGGFVAVYPQGLVAPADITHFNNTQAAPPEPDDVAFVSRILDDLESQLCIDAARVYATGYSNGAQMSVRLACSLSERIAAVGLVAGAYYPPEWEGTSESCTGGRAVPVIAFHGTGDPIIPFEGGGPLAVRLPIDDDTAAEDVLSDWALHDVCSAERHQSDIGSGVQLVRYDGCDSGASVQLYITQGGGHAWPGSPYAAAPDDGSSGVDATELIWEFFQDYSLDGASQPDADGDGTADLHDADNDNDGCPDLTEQQTAPGSELRGGRRDPKNPWDYFNPTQDGQNRIDDVLAVVRHYGLSLANPGYDMKYDRTYVGPEPWNLGPPDGLIGGIDILAAAYQYGHNCR